MFVGDADAVCIKRLTQFFPPPPTARGYCASVARLPTPQSTDPEPLMPQIQFLNPDSLGKPLGQYSHITRVKASEFLFIAGQVGVAKDGTTRPTSKPNAPRPSPISARLCNRKARALPICRVHDLYGAFAGHPEVHAIPDARIPAAVSRWCLSAEHAADDRPAGA